MLVKPKTTGVGKVVSFKRRQVRRLPRRPLEAVPQDFERWDAAAAVLGLNWSEFTRRALNAACGPGDAAFYGIAMPSTPQIIFRASEKPGSKKRARARAKATGTRAGRKG